MKDGVTFERIDKWLWQVRVFKTRNKASLACEKGKVTINENKVKPSGKVKINQIIIIKFKTYCRTVKALDYPARRVGAKMVEKFMQDLTPEEEYAKKRMIETSIFAGRTPGTGRPTKKDRRQLNKLKNKC